MSGQLSKDSFKKKCSEDLSIFSKACADAICRTDEEVREALRNFRFKMLDGVVFRTGHELQSANIKASKEILEFVGPDFASLSEVKELLYKSYVVVLETDEYPSKDKFVDQVHEKISAFLENGFSYVGPCNLFEFGDGLSGLLNRHVSILPAEDCVKSALPVGNEQWSFCVADEHGVVPQDGKLFLNVSGLCWIIKTSRPRDLVREEARWMSQVFVSFIRLKMRQADFCPRPKIGEVEPDIFSDKLHKNPGFLFSDEGFHGGGGRLEKSYRIDGKASEDFHSEQFQRKLNTIFEKPKATMAERLFNGLGWLSRGRQSSSVSERLLFFFTALEALLSDKDAFVPVADDLPLNFHPAGTGALWVDTPIGAG
jgi:hypothetical protein